MSKTDLATIREEYEAKTSRIMQRLERVAGDKAAQFPPAYVAQERTEVLAELRSLESQYRQRAEDARNGALSTAQTVRLNPDSEDQAARTADLLEADMLHRRFPDKTVARNHLEDETRRLLAAGNVRAANVRLAAMKLSGAFVAQLERDVEAALDEALPHRKQAREMEDQTNEDYVAHRIAELAARRRANLLAGNDQRATAASAGEKLARYVADPENYAGTAAVTGSDS